ncbi:hypothetical protein BC834DRAFT_352274 [Gloeopeniophorella convolvens]|nr:hypothetical protein BC834DRAFT_352274 [Gloeopeniophorella convolvens]
MSPLLSSLCCARTAESCAGSLQTSVQFSRGRVAKVHSRVASVPVPGLLLPLEQTNSFVHQPQFSACLLSLSQDLLELMSGVLDFFPRLVPLRFAFGIPPCVLVLSPLSLSAKITSEGLRTAPDPCKIGLQSRHHDALLLFTGLGSCCAKLRGLSGLQCIRVIGKSSLELLNLQLLEVELMAPVVVGILGRGLLFPELVRLLPPKSP